MSVVYQTSPSWHSFSSIRHWVIFGDSYSAVHIGYNERNVPCSDNPMGVPFPGYTYNEQDKPNWIGHMITKYSAEPLFNPTADVQTDEFDRNPLLVYDYARGGDTVAGIRRQIEQLFIPSVGKKPEWAPWEAHNTLFVTWVGINDCAYLPRAGPESILDALFEVQEQVYETGARNFLFIDVPTIHRSPAVPASHQASSIAKYEKWNSYLGTCVQRFCEKHPDVTAFLFSSFHAFNVLLDDPGRYGCLAADVKKFGGSIWVDHLHPTSQVHDHVAESIADFLNTIPASATAP